MPITLIPAEPQPNRYDLKSSGNESYPFAVEALSKRNFALDLTWCHFV